MKKAVIKKQEPIIILRGNKRLTTSLIVADKFEVKHKDVLRKIERLVERGTKDRLIFTPIFYKDKYDREQKVYEMDKKNFIILAMRFTSDRALNWQIKFVDKFEEYENAAIQRTSAEWIETRQSGKLVRRLVTDTIKEFIEYCTAQGSKNANNYYMLLTRMMNSALFIVEGKFDNLREWMNTEQLKVVSIVETIIDNALRIGIDGKLEYHDAFKFAKKKVIEFVGLYGKTKILSNQLVTNQPNQLQLF